MPETARLISVYPVGQEGLHEHPVVVHIQLATRKSAPALLVFHTPGWQSRLTTVYAAASFILFISVDLYIDNKTSDCY